MNNILATITRLNSTGVSPLEIEAIFAAYEKIPEHLRNHENLLETVRSRYPHMFTTDIHGSEAINLEEQMRRKHVVLGDESHSLEKLSGLLKDVGGHQDFITIRSKLQSAFPDAEFHYSERVKKPETFIENSSLNKNWARVDAIGMRIVPKNSQGFPALIQRFESLFGHHMAFKLNLFLKENKESTRIHKSNPHYFALHYHIAFPPFFIEIQMRTPAIDIWSIVTHSTLYKKKVKITAEEEAALMEFGRIADCVDFYNLIS